jgi:hypothetical protein
MRQFSDRNYTTTKAHKLYQGIFIANPGDYLSITTYFDLLQILSDTYRCQTGTSTNLAADIAAWLGDNIRASFESRTRHQNSYLTLGAMLGVRELLHMGTSVHYAEIEFTDEELSRFPKLRQFQDGNNGQNKSPTERYLDNLFTVTLGLTWPEFQGKYQICVSSQTYDLVLGHNLTLWHGGLLGGPGRLIEPICFVLDKPIGTEYESWLAQAWRIREFIS